MATKDIGTVKMTKENLLDFQTFKKNEKWYTIKLYNEFDNWAYIENILTTNKNHLTEEGEVLIGKYDCVFHHHGEEEPYSYVIEEVDLDSHSNEQCFFCEKTTKTLQPLQTDEENAVLSCEECEEKFEENKKFEKYNQNILSLHQYDENSINLTVRDQISIVGKMLDTTNPLLMKKYWKKMGEIFESDEKSLQLENLVTLVSRVNELKLGATHRWAGLHDGCNDGFVDLVYDLEKGIKDKNIFWFGKQETYNPWDNFVLRKTLYDIEEQERIANVVMGLMYNKKIVFEGEGDEEIYYKIGDVNNFIFELEKIFENSKINDWIPGGNGSVSEGYYETFEFKLKDFDGYFSLELSSYEDEQWSLHYFND